MRKFLMNWLLAASFVFLAGGALVSTATPQVAGAACNDRILGFPTWYRGVEAGECSGISPSASLEAYIWKIGLNIVEMILVAVGYVCVGFLIYGGFKYMTSAGDPTGVSGAKSTILNAIIGLVISFFSVVIVTMVAGNIS